MSGGFMSVSGGMCLLGHDARLYSGGSLLSMG